MVIGDRNSTTGKPSETLINPGDEAPAGTTGTGEDICPDCAGTGRKDGGACSTCNGTGKVMKGIGGA